MGEVFYRAGEVAKILNVSKSYIYLLIKRGEIPCLQLGKARRIRSTDLDEFILRKTKSSYPNSSNHNKDIFQDNLIW